MFSSHAGRLFRHNRYSSVWLFRTNRKVIISADFGAHDIRTKYFLARMNSGAAAAAVTVARIIHALGLFMVLIKHDILLVFFASAMSNMAEFFSHKFEVAAVCRTG